MLKKEGGSEQGLYADTALIAVWLAMVDLVSCVSAVMLGPLERVLVILSSCSDLGGSISFKKSSLLSVSDFLILGSRGPFER
jgi:hypothetical protein